MQIYTLIRNYQQKVSKCELFFFVVQLFVE